MKTSKLATALGMAALATVAFASTANAASCNSYGDTAKMQQRENSSLGCGFSGQRWHTNNYAHRIFCLAVGEDNADTETEIRDHKLQTCRMAKAAERFGDNEVIVENYSERFAENELIVENNLDNEHFPGRFGEVEIVTVDE